MKKYLLTILILSAFISFSFAQDQKIWQKFSIITKDNLTSFLWLIDYSNLPDDNIQKFVWVNQPFSNKSYEPTDLVSLQWRSHISAQARHTFRKEAADALEKMANDFYAQFSTNIVVASAWLAVDLWEATNEQKFLSKYQKYYNWLHDNAHLYWFHQSYQNWREFDGYYIEPRHWRYLWIELATKLHKKDITFTQYVNLTKANIK